MSGYSAGPQQSPLQGYSSGGMDSANMKKLLFMAALSDPKNTAKYSGLSTMAEGLQPSKTNDQLKRERLLQQASPVVGQVIESARKAPTGIMGSLKALLGKIPGVEGGEAEYLSRDIEGYARLIASVFASEVGVATDKDVQRWLNIMPRPGDTANERKRQSQKLVDRVTAEAKAYNMEVPPDIMRAAQLLGGETGRPSSFIPD